MQVKTILMAQLGKAIDQVRAEEARKLKREGYESILNSTRWLFLKRPEHLTAKQASKLADLLRYNLMDGARRRCAQRLSR